MKKFKLGNAVFLALLLTACSNDKKEASTEKPATTKPSSSDNIIQFTVDGKTVTTSGWTISRFDFGGGTCVNVTSNMHEQPQTVNININGEHAGTYSFDANHAGYKTPGIAYGSYMPDYMKDMTSPYSFRDGDFTIVSIDTTTGLLNATFHGMAKNTKGESVTITDGKVINGKLKAGVTRAY